MPYHHFIRAPILLCLLVVSCSSIDNNKGYKDKGVQETEQEAAEDLKTISDELIALVEPSTTEAAAIEKSAQTESIVNSKQVSDKNINIYLEQENQLMANVSAEVILQYQQGVTAMGKKQWQQANNFFEQVILAQPKLSGAYVNKALIAMAQSKMIIAQFQIDKALKINNLNPYAHNIQGQLARLKGDFVKAEESYLTALKLWPNYAEVHWNLAVLLELYRGRYSEAKNYYLSFLQLKPEDSQVKRSIAGLEIKMARLEK